MLLLLNRNVHRLGLLLAAQLLVVFFLIDLLNVGILLPNFKLSLNSEVLLVNCLLMRQ